MQFSVSRFSEWNGRAETVNRFLLDGTDKIVSEFAIRNFISLANRTRLRTLNYETTPFEKFYEKPWNM